VRNGTCLELLN
jgi:hypothetical protein